MKRFWCAAVFVVSGLLFGCATPLVVDHDYDTTYDFTKLKMYMWVPSPPGNNMEELTAKRFESAVNSQLQAKGYMASAETPDFLVALKGVRKTVESGSVGVGASVAVPVGQHGAVHLGGGKSKPRTKQEGTLNIAIHDAKTGGLIWEGSATASMKEKLSPEEQQQAINQVVAEVLKTFPPQKK